MDKLEIRKIITNILYRASVNEEFRNRALNDGKNLLEELMEEKLDTDVKVTFIENKNKGQDIGIDGKDILFILPDFVGPLNKLNKDDLEKLNGGLTEFVEENSTAIDRLFEIYSVERF